MYVREQAGSTQLIRTTYDPVVKRGRQTVFARFPDATTAPDDVRSLCTPAELLQLDEYLAAKLAAITANKHQNRLKIGTYSIDGITDAIASISAEKDADAIANKLWTATLKLQKALKSAGFSRPVKLAKAQVVNEAQPELSV
jgi:hypothetical protein